MKKLSFIILSYISIAADMATDFTFGVDRHDLSGSITHESSIQYDSSGVEINNIKTGVIKAIYPVVSMEGGISYSLKDKWGTAMRMKVGGPSVLHDLSEVDVTQNYNMSAQWLLTYGQENSYIQIGPLWQRSKMIFGWRELSENFYLDGYGVAFGVYHPLFRYVGLRVNFQHVINNSVHPCNQNAESNRIGILKTDMSQLSIALSSDLSVILN